MGLCLAVAALVVPLALKLPVIAEAEIVMAVWWGVWVVTLTALLYRGNPVDDDAEWVGKGANRIKSWLGFGNLPWDMGCWIDGGCASFVLAIFAFFLLGLAFLLLIEFVLPAIAILLFLSVGGMLARAVNDTHHCEGRLGPSLFWGSIWAIVYVGPVAAVVIWVAALLK